MLLEMYISTVCLTHVHKYFLTVAIRSVTVLGFMCKPLLYSLFIFISDVRVWIEVQFLICGCFVPPPLVE